MESKASNEKGGNVYVLLKQGHIYIGSTTRLVQTRLKEHQRQSVSKVYLLAYAWCSEPRRQEKELHEQFNKLRGRSDFFVLTDTQLQQLINLVNQL